MYANFLLKAFRKTHFRDMDFIQSHNRNHLEMMSLESLISQENPVRLIDAFAEKLDLEKLGFTVGNSV